jgi:SAM-dependent methyltransferase
MTRDESIIELGQWLQTPAGRYLLHWEQGRLDDAVADVFGYHALQLGLTELDALRNNRMPHRWVAADSTVVPRPIDLAPGVDGDGGAPRNRTGVALHCEFDALPFPDRSIDLVVLPHTLETSRDPHRALSEVERVLVPEGRVMIVGLNPASLWGLRQRMGRGSQAVGLNRRHALFLPRGGEFLGYRRVRDWLRLLSFEVEGGRFGCWRPPVQTQVWLDRWQWVERVGERWWPVLGAVYFIAAVKRVRGMRLVGLARQEARRTNGAPAVVANRQREAAPVERTRCTK